MDKKENLFRRAGSFSLTERKQIVQEYLTGNINKSDLWFKHTGSYKEHGNINRWLIQLGMSPQYCKYDSRSEKRATFEQPNCITLSKQQPKSSEDPKSPTVEELQQQVEALKAELEMEKLRREGYEIMIDIAENQLNIPIRKKSSTKQ